MEIDQKQLRELMRALKQFDVQELEIEKNGERIYLRRGADPAQVAPLSFAPSMMPAPPPTPVVALSPALSERAADPNVVDITSPFVGTFYRSPSPDAAAFVDVGSEIRSGQVLCIVEAMKLMNEIEAEISGTLVEVVAANGRPVEFGEVLFRVRKSS
jgi:acetyl-CoA carboxylase biotin carboxyl carrier protein